MAWGFYGRGEELDELASILRRRRWFFARITGRRRIGKTTLIQQALQMADRERVLYVAHVRQVSPAGEDQLGAYLNALMDRYGLVERRLPIFARPKARRGRYDLRDNFLRAWLGCLASPVSAINFRPEPVLVEQADAGLQEAEGFGLGRLVGRLYEERSRKAVGDFPLTRRIDGYWDRADTEIDLVALDDDDRVIRFGTCKRSPAKLVADLPNFDAHVERFLDAHPACAAGPCNGWPSRRRWMALRAG